MRERAKTYRDGADKVRSSIERVEGNYPKLALRAIDRLAPVIAELIESEQGACPHCLALAIENFAVAPAIAALTAGLPLELKGQALRSIVDIKSAALGFQCVSARVEDISPQHGGLH
jgi:hypothetical protein